MPQLVEIENEIGNILAVADELAPDQEPVALEYLEELALQEAEKADAIAYAIRKRQAEIEFLKEEENRLKGKRAVIVKRLEEFKDYLARLFEREGISNIKGLKGTLYLRSTSRVEIENIGLLPADMVRTEVNFVPMKKEISDQLKRGLDVPGAKTVDRKVLAVR